MKVKFTGFTSIVDPDTKEDILDGIVKDLEEQPQAIEQQEIIAKPGGILLNGMVDPNEKKKQKRPKERAPKIIFVFDDLSDEIKKKSLTALVKKNRHFRSKVIIASQYWNDLDLQARKQMNYVLIWPQLHSKLEEIHKNLELSIPFALFVNMYTFCTEERFHFMWIDADNSEIRKDFTHALKIPRQLMEGNASDDREA